MRYSTLWMLFAGWLDWVFGSDLVGWLTEPLGLGLFVLDWVCLAGALVSAGWALIWDEPESLILAQSERWRHA